MFKITENENIFYRKYQKIRSLGEGKAGEVIEAKVLKKSENLKIGEKVAIKLYKPWVLNRPNQFYRIKRELNAGMRFSSNHVVKTYELSTVGSQPFLVMEFLNGVTLSQWLKKDHLLDFNTIINISLDIAEGISALHRNGLIHRDIKPDNVMLTNRGAVITDLGVVKDITVLSSITGKEFLGTIRYAAPEYLFGEDYDNSIDIYSFGAILHQLIFKKSIIDPELYWSKQVLMKKYDLHNSLLRNEYYERFGFQESVFLSVLLSGTLIKSKARFSINQIISAIKNRIWEGEFLHYVNEKVINEWPSLPMNLKKDVELFIKKEPHPRLKEFRIDLFNASGSLSHDVWCDELDTEGVNKLNELYRLGLITRPLVDENGDVIGDLTPLAWQLLLKNYFS